YIASFLASSPLLHIYYNHLLFFLFFLLIRPQPRSTLFPYTTLFRSRRRSSQERARCCRRKRKAKTRRKAKPVARRATGFAFRLRSEEHTSELQSRGHLVCRLLLEKKKKA